MIVLPLDQSYAHGGVYEQSGMSKSQIRTSCLIVALHTLGSGALRLEKLFYLDPCLVTKWDVRIHKSHHHVILFHNIHLDLEPLILGKLSTQLHVRHFCPTLYYWCSLSWYVSCVDMLMSWNIVEGINIASSLDALFSLSKNKNIWVDLFWVRWASILDCGTGWYHSQIMIINSEWGLYIV